MENGSYKILEATVQRTLHAHHFARSSSYASIVFTDLLSRYLALLANTCTKHAAHAGRLSLAPLDVLNALEECGVNVEDLADYCATEAREMSRYAGHTARRVEDLNEFRTALSQGLREDRDDAFQLFYAPLPDDLLEMGDQGMVSELTSDVEMDEPMGEISAAPGHDRHIPPEASSSSQLHSSTPLSSSSSLPRSQEFRLPPSPPNIPDHLPPLPRISTYTDDPEQRSSSPMQTVPPVSHASLSRPEKSLATAAGPAGPALQASMQASAADYTTPVPYDSSTLRDVAEWHLPQPYPLPSTSKPSTALPTPLIQPSLFSAYHHVLTHPPSKTNAQAPNPSRHRIALGLMAENERMPRWEPPDTLFGTSTPPMPQLARMPPSHPMAITNPQQSPRHETAPDPSKEKTLPSMQARALVGNDRLVPLITQQQSRIPELSREILPPALYKRITRLNDPPVLMRGNERLVYGPSIPAPWNSAPNPSPAPPKEAKPTLVNGDGEEVSTEVAFRLPDAKLYHTWDYEQKRFWEPLTANRAIRNKLAQMPPSMQQAQTPALSAMEPPSRRASMISIPPSSALQSPTVDKLGRKSGLISISRRESNSAFMSRRDSIASRAE